MTSSNSRLLAFVLWCAAVSIPFQSTTAQIVADFETVGAGLSAESYYNGSDAAGGFQSASLFFNNTFTPSTGFGDSWAGWSYSNVTDNTTPGFGNQFGNIVGQGDSGSSIFAIAFEDKFNAILPEIQTSNGHVFQSLSITNTTYAALSMLNGDAFAKQFGGATGNDPDYFKVDILSLDSSGNEVGSIPFYLADYRFADNSLDFIIDAWTTVDVSSLNATRLGFRFEGTDVGMFGLNTPSYLALDNVVVAVPEPAISIGLLLLGLSFSAGRKRRMLF